VKPAKSVPGCKPSERQIKSRLHTPVFRTPNSISATWLRETPIASASASCVRPFRSQKAVERPRRGRPRRLPDLVRLTDPEVRIPRMQVITLERLAALDGESVSAVLARELRDLVSVHAPWLQVEVPGFATALAWPAVP